MFKFLKEKLKSTISTITEKFNAVAKEEIIEEEVKAEQPVSSKQTEQQLSQQQLPETKPEITSKSEIMPEPETKLVVKQEQKIEKPMEKKDQLTFQLPVADQKPQQKTQQQSQKKPQLEQPKEKKKLKQDEPKVVPKKKVDYKFEEKQLGVSSEPSIINDIKEDEIKPVEIERPSFEVESKDIGRTFIEVENKAVEENLNEQKPDELQELTESKKVIEEEEKQGFFSKLKSKFFAKKEEFAVKVGQKQEEQLVTMPTAQKIPIKKVQTSEEKQKIETIASSQQKTIEKISDPIKTHSEISLPQKETSLASQKPAQEIIQEEAKGFFSKIKQKVTAKRLDEKQFEGLFWELEVALLENNVAVEVIEKIKLDLKQTLVDKPITRTKVDAAILTSLKQSIESLFDIPSIGLLEKIKTKRQNENAPYVICFFGINGSGKTTSIAKISKYFLANKQTVVLAAADTFRAAAIDQLQLHANALGIRMIKHDYGSDPAAVAFDAIAHAKAHNIDVVLIDTAGRMHSNTNLVDEMKKIVRVSKPDLKIFVGEAIVGNDAVEQCKQFNAAVGIDGIVLAKADVDEKGGAAISISYVTKKPIIFLGVGQSYEDLELFDKEKIIASVGLET
ncbi:signal recognition particle-docking protein FtsY [Candidatus Woesearchaeota archaeon]|nr:signal recognition particle-docking protein FtsY [Candidatus Woesearchaeota archaeon]